MYLHICTCRCIHTKGKKENTLNTSIIIHPILSFSGTPSESKSATGCVNCGWVMRPMSPSACCHHGGLLTFATGDAGVLHQAFGTKPWWPWWPWWLENEVENWSFVFFMDRQNPPEGMGDQPLRYPQTEWLSNLQWSIARRWWLLGFDTSPIGRIQCMWPFGTSTSSKQQPSRLEKWTNFPTMRRGKIETIVFQSLLNTLRS